MEQQQRDLRKEREDLERLYEAIKLLFKVGDEHKHLAGNLAMEVEELVRRYTQSPSPDVEVHVKIPLRIFGQYLECHAAPRSEDILLSGIEEIIAKHREAEEVLAAKVKGDCEQ